MKLTILIDITHTEDDGDDDDGDEDKCDDDEDNYLMDRPNQRSKK